MREVVEFLVVNPVQYLSTVGSDGKPKVRPFQLMIEADGKLFFCTSNQKEVFAELTNCPHVEISVSSPNFQWMRLSGKVIFTSDTSIKARILEASPVVKSIYQTADNPAFEAFYLADAKAVIADFSGNPPREYSI